MTDEAVLDRLLRLEIETPSWGYGDSGTRFHVYPWPGRRPRPCEERIADAALVHRLTGCCPTVALHIPWDAVDDYAALRRYAEERGRPHRRDQPEPVPRRRVPARQRLPPRSGASAREAIDHCLECVEIASEVGSTIISLWLADGTNYPGQDDLRAPHARLVAGPRGGLRRCCPAGMRLLVEYKFFEPALLQHRHPRLGHRALVCRQLGPQAQVLVDTGHHPQGMNIEQIVALLLDEGKLGGFHFNDRKYADDDLIVGSIDPFELFLIMRELAHGEAPRHVAYMIDQSHNVEGKIEAMIQSVMNIQTAYAKALLVDRERWPTRRLDGDVLGAHRVLLDAFETDVRPLLAEVRRGARHRPRAARGVPRERLRRTTLGPRARDTPRSRAPTKAT